MPGIAVGQGEPTDLEGTATVARTVLLMLLVLIVGGAAAIYVWSSINDILKGEASLVQIALTLLAIGVIAGLVYVLQRVSTSAEDS